MITPYDDNYFMKQALQEADLAAEEGEVPVGAVIVCDGRIIARTHNETEKLNDVTAHAAFACKIELRHYSVNVGAPEYSNYSGCYKDYSDICRIRNKHTLSNRVVGKEDHCISRKS